MSLDRIQKLLFSEYSDFGDIVLIEGSFAEVTRRGLGLRQVQVGLTSSKLIVATDVVRNVTEYPIYFYPGRIDPEIELMELISIFPIEFVALSIHQRRRRKVIKARFHNGNPNNNLKVVYYELNGSFKTKMLWNLWCEKVRFLASESPKGSSTEASIASSTSVGSLYLAKTRITGDKIWQYYSGFNRSVPQNLRGKGTAILHPSESEEWKIIYSSQDCDKSCTTITTSTTDILSKVSRVNRFSEGVDENCTTRLCLPPTPLITKAVGLNFTPSNNLIDFCDVAVTMWEKDRKKRGILSPISSTYNFGPFMDLNFGVGIYSTDRAGRLSLQMKKSRSLISVKEERFNTMKTEEYISSRRHLDTTQSAEVIGARQRSRQNSHDQVQYFWTTDYWYKPDKVRQKMNCSRLKNNIDVNKKEKRRFGIFGRKRSSMKNIPDEQAVVELRNSLSMKNQLSVWDIDSSALAFQLTIIDVKLYLKIPAVELTIIRRCGRARNCRNFFTWLIYSHRVSCLIATQVLLQETVKGRARLIARFIWTCEKSHRLNNNHSTNSVLHGLQCPAVFRMQNTWAYVRQYHATAYQKFKSLCRIYSRPFRPDFTKPPCLPSANIILQTLLQQIDGKDERYALRSEITLPQIVSNESTLPKIMHQIFSVFTSPHLGSKITPCGEEVESSNYTGDSGDCMRSMISAFDCAAVERAEDLLRMGQQAARKYDLCGQYLAKEFLLKVPYEELSVNFLSSLNIEPSYPDR